MYFDYFRTNSRQSGSLIESEKNLGKEDLDESFEEEITVVHQENLEAGTSTSVGGPPVSKRLKRSANAVSPLDEKEMLLIEKLKLQNENIKIDTIKKAAETYRMLIEIDVPIPEEVRIVLGLE